jgi:hypothetical protein
MPSFSFAVVAKRQQKRSVPAITLTKVYTKVEGVVGITIEGNYYVKVGGREFPITAISFNCEGKECIYSKELHDERRLAIYRLPTEKHAKHAGYLPFAPGSCVIGDIVTMSNNIRYTFNIKKVYYNPANNDAKNEYIFWRDNYDTIRNNQSSKLIIEDE